MTDPDKLDARLSRVYDNPGDKQSPAGKLRLSYEANPLSFVAEQAGGAGSTGTTRVLPPLPKTVTWPPSSRSCRSAQDRLTSSETLSPAP